MPVKNILLLSCSKQLLIRIQQCLLYFQASKFQEWVSGKQRNQAQSRTQATLLREEQLVVAKIRKTDKAELKVIAERWRAGTEWRFQTLTFLNEKTAYIHTPCRIIIDLRKAKACAQLQSTSFPQTPVPTVTITDVLQLKQTQRFDLMAIAAKIIAERNSATGIYIADARLVDGSKQNEINTAEYAVFPVTLF